MKMYIYTKNEDAASKPGWIVKVLYLLGLMQVLVCAILGAIFARPFIAVWLTRFDLSESAANSASLLIGVGAGVAVGVLSGLVYFALSQALEDLHALRVLVSSYVAIDVERED